MSRAPELAIRLLSDRRRSLILWAVGLALYTALIIAVYPTIRDSASFAVALEDYPEPLQELFGGETGFDMTSGPGFLGAELYSLVVPLLLAIVAIGYGAVLGSEQESGLLDLILANPLSRRRVILERALTIVVVVTGLSTVVATVVAVGDPLVRLDIGISPLMAATVANVALAVLHGFVALIAAAIVGRRSVAVGAATMVFAVGYLLHVVASLVDGLRSLRLASPFYHANGVSPLATGWSAGNVSVLVVLCLAALVGAVVAFERRDLT